MDYGKLKYHFAAQGGPSIVFEFDVLQTTGNGGGTLAGQYVLHGNSSVPPSIAGASDVSSFSTGISMAGTVVIGGGGAGKANFKDFSMQKAFDLQTMQE